MRSFLKKIIYKESFYPGFIGLFINPFYFARKGLACHVQCLARYVTGKTLDIGCGSKPYEKLFKTSEYIGLEYDSPENRKSKKADYFYDGHTFPFESNEFDSIVANEVFEHVFNPDEFLGEISRVLKNDGVLLMTVPFVWDEHEQPYDYARYSSFGLKSILETHGFIIIEQRKSMDDIRVIFQLLNAYLYKQLVSSNPYINLLTTLLFMAPVNIVGEFMALLLPKNSDLYLDNIILAVKLSDKT